MNISINIEFITAASAFVVAITSLMLGMKQDKRSVRHDEIDSFKALQTALEARIALLESELRKSVAQREILEKENHDLLKRLVLYETSHHKVKSEPT